jgi:hypothetical protein
MSALLDFFDGGIHELPLLGRIEIRVKDLARSNDREVGHLGAQLG